MIVQVSFTLPLLVLPLQIFADFFLFFFFFFKADFTILNQTLIYATTVLVGITMHPSPTTTDCLANLATEACLVMQNELLPWQHANSAVLDDFLTLMDMLFLVPIAILNFHVNSVNRASGVQCRVLQKKVYVKIAKLGSTRPIKQPYLLLPAKNAVLVNI